MKFQKEKTAWKIHNSNCNDNAEGEMISCKEERIYKKDERIPFHFFEECQKENSLNCLWRQVSL